MTGPAPRADIFTTHDIPWLALLSRLSCGEAGTLDQLLWAAHDCGRICGHGRAK